ncbi:MAG: ABC transporter substrate-binding protein [Deltaproteobacteria bacterium]|nr:ABC transporter substrate-binding protein [Deltaproteobacteria bacterium]
MRRARRALALGMALGMLGLACAAPPPSVDARQRSAYAAALRLAADDAAAGQRALGVFLSRYPDSALATRAALRLAELQVAAGAPGAAIRNLAQQLAQQPTAVGSDQARLLLARLYSAAGRPLAGYRAAREIRFARLSEEARPRAWRLLANLAPAAEAAPERLRWLAELRAAAAEEEAQRKLDAEIETALLSLNAAGLAEAGALPGARPLAAHFWLDRAERALNGEAIESARSALLALQGRNLRRGEAERFRRYQERSRLLFALPGFTEPPPKGRNVLAPRRVPGTLGVLLPLSGPYADFGEEALQGILLATGLAAEAPGHAEAAAAKAAGARRGEHSRANAPGGPGRPDGRGGPGGPGGPEAKERGALARELAGRDIATPGGLRLRIRDTAGDPQQARAALREFAAGATAAVLGPLLPVASEEAAAAAEAQGLPIFPFTRREQVGTGRSRVFRLGATPRLEAMLLAEFAMRRLGLQRFAVLYPDIAFGHALREAFESAVEARGGEITGAALYESGATDFSAPIRSLIGFGELGSGQRVALAERARLRKLAKRRPPPEAARLRWRAARITGPEETPLPPFVEFEAVFIPDTHEAVGLIAPQLAFHEVRGIRLLGTDGWNHPSLLTLGNEHVDGAVFTGGYFAGSALPQVRRFERSFREFFGAAPGELAALGYDGANLALAGLELARRGVEDKRRKRGEPPQALRAALAGALRGERFFWRGVSGVISFRPGGKLRKRPHLLGVENGLRISIGERGEPPFLRIPDPVRHCLMPGEEWSPGPDVEIEYELEPCERFEEELRAERETEAEAAGPP